MKQIKILGELAQKYVDEIELDVNTPGEALRALNVNYPGFLQDAESYTLILMAPENAEDTCRQVTDTMESNKWNDNEVLMLVPNVEGNAWAAAGAVAGALAASGTLAYVAIYAVVYIVVSVAISVAVSAIAGLISGGPEAISSNDVEDVNNKTSYLYNGVVNTNRQGHRIQLLYGGPLLVGSSVLSSRINTKDV